MMLTSRCAMDREKKRRFSFRNSIRTEFAVIFIVVMALTIAVFWIINSVFLQRYYIKDKQSRLMKSYESTETLISAFENDDDAFKQAFIQMCSASNINAAIVTTSIETVVSTTGDNNIMIARLFDHIFDVDDPFINGDFSGGNMEPPPGKDKKPGEKPEGSSSYEPVILYKNDRYEICIADDPRMGIDYLELWGSLSDGNIIIMRTALNSIRESVSVSNRFLGYVGFVMVLISAVIIYMITRKITKPIEELAVLSERMSALDFEAKYESGGNNEIGVLGEHMNELSGTLEKTISELKTSNNELKRDIEKKEKQDSMRRDFLSNVAHELKTPIALVQGYAEGLRDGIADTPEDRDYYCGVIMDEADKMNKLVKDLMTLNELEFGKDLLSFERFDMTALVRGCIQSNELILSQNGIRLDFDVDKPCFVWSDEFRTEEVFTNYLSNAIHYCAEPHGKAGGEKRIEVRFGERNNNLRISVFNTGEPIAEEALPHLFEKFYKVDKARTREYGGSGVGLSIVKAIMDALNKDYGVENHEDGTAFWFELDREAGPKDADDE